jgi:adenylate kinase family enzyme
VRRIAVIGAGGAGKTILAHRLGAILGLPVTHLDQLRYHSDWTLVPDAVFHDAQQKLADSEAWVVDGNYLASLPIRVAAADMIILLDPHPLVCLAGIAARRWHYHGGQHPDGAFDRISVDFLRYVWRYRRRHLPRVLACIATHGEHAELLHLTSRRQVDRLVASLTRPAGNT